MSDYSPSSSAQYGLGLAPSPSQPGPEPPPQPERLRSEPISAQRYSPDKGYQTASGYYDPAQEASSPPPGELETWEGTQVDTWA